MAEIILEGIPWGEVEFEVQCPDCLTVFRYKRKETYDRVNPNYRPIDWRRFVKCPKVGCGTQIVTGISGAGWSHPPKDYNKCVSVPTDPSQKGSV